MSAISDFKDWHKTDGMGSTTFFWTQAKTNSHQLILRLQSPSLLNVRIVLPNCSVGDWDDEYFPSTRSARRSIWQTMKRMHDHWIAWHKVRRRLSDLHHHHRRRCWLRLSRCHWLILELFHLCYKRCLRQNTVKSAWNDSLLF